MFGATGSGRWAAAWGSDARGQLGNDFITTTHELPEGIGWLSAAKQVIPTYESTYVLLNDGTLLSWGGNDFGQLGDGTRAPKLTPVAILTGVSQIAVGGGHGIALMTGGTLMTWGGDNFGELGNGTTGFGHEGTSSLVPIPVAGVHNVVQVAASGGSDAALLANGSVLAWGENRSGQLGDGTMLEKTVPTPVHGLAGVRAIAFGGDASLGGHMLALMGDGTVMAVGANGGGQLGDNSFALDSTVPVHVSGLTHITAISASVSHNMALTESGTVLTWGVDSDGELGVGTSPQLCRLIACSRIPVAVTGLSGVTSISAGMRYSLATSGGRLYAWGSNETGTLGDGTQLDRHRPELITALSSVVSVVAGEHHSVAMLSHEGPPPSYQVAPGPGSLTVSWTAPAGTEKWDVEWRVSGGRFTPWVQLPPEARSYTITGLAAQPYEVLVRDESFHASLIRATPLAASAAVAAAPLAAPRAAGPSPRTSAGGRRR